jgi:uncharacterized membrane protein YphA (DoxX/SURF4 family)
MNHSIKNKIHFAFTLLFGLLFINAGLDKLFHYMPMPDNIPEKMQKAFTAIAELGWLLPLIGIAELAGGLLIIFPKTRALGAIIIFPVMVGIFLTNTVQDTQGLPIVIILGIIWGWIIYVQREKYLPIIR